MNTFVAAVILLILILAAMLGVFQIFSLVGAQMSGWSKLAQLYRAPEDPEQELIPIPRAQIGGVVYKNSILARPSPEGLHLRAWLLDRLMHRPLLIPWAAVKGTELVEPARYMVQALSEGEGAAAFLIRLGLKEIATGLQQNPQLRNVVLQIECAGKTIELQLLMDGSEIARYLPSG